MDPGADAVDTVELDDVSDVGAGRGSGADELGGPLDTPCHDDDHDHELGVAPVLETQGPGPGRRRLGSAPRAARPRAVPVPPRWACSTVALAVAVAATALLPELELGFGAEEYKGQAPAQRCLGLVIAVAVLWGSEVIPSYITALCIPVLVVVGRVMCVPRRIRLYEEDDTLLVPASYCNTTVPLPGHPMEPHQAVVVATGQSNASNLKMPGDMRLAARTHTSHHECARAVKLSQPGTPNLTSGPSGGHVALPGAFFNPVVMLFLSGFAMSRVMDKYHLSSRVAFALLASGGPPRRLLLMLMAISVVSSSFLSNVPAAVLVTALVSQTFKGNEHTSWPRASLLGIAYSCNIGGMASPIASPQNVIATIALSTATRGEVSFSFAEWLKVSVPFCLVATLLCWLFICVYFRAGLPAEIKPLRRKPTRVRTQDEESITTSLLEEADDAEASEGDDGTASAASVASASVSALASASTERVEPAGASSACCARCSRSRPGPPCPASLVLLVCSRCTFPSPCARVWCPVCPPSVVPGACRSISLPDVVICATVVVTVTMWVLFDLVRHIFGNIGIVALLPIIVFGSLG